MKWIYEKVKKKKKKNEKNKKKKLFAQCALAVFSKWIEVQIRF